MRDAIDAALADPKANTTTLSRRFEVSPDSLQRHRRDHLPTPAMRQALAELTAQEGLRGLRLIDQAERLRDDALVMRAEAMAAGDRLAAIRAAREARGCVELLARLAGEVQDLHVNVGVSIIGTPAWGGVQAAILAALLPHPAARGDVLRALEGLI